MVEEDGELAEGEVVDGLPVVAEEEEGVLVEARSGLGAALSVPTVQAAALAATGFAAGAVTVAAVSRRRSRKAAKKKGKGAIGEIMSSNSFLIDVHLLRRD